MAAADLEKIKKGEEPLLVQSAGPFFDIMDADKDGFITLEDSNLGMWPLAGVLSVLNTLSKYSTRTIQARLDVTRSSNLLMIFGTN